MSTIEIARHRPGKGTQDFVEAGRTVFAGDTKWVPPLTLMLSDQLNPKSNPLFAHADVALFTARRDGKLVGRISATIDRNHLLKFQDKTGFFGFFDTVDDVEVAQALLDAAGDWLRDRGMERMRGPMSLSINEEVGLLIEGFEHPPMVMMAHSRPYQQRLADACGLQKEKDLYAWRWPVVEEMPKRALRALEQIRDMPEVTIREARVDEEMDQLIEIQSDAWKDNWAHVTLSKAEARKVASDMKLLIDPAIAIVAEIDGELAAMSLALPNLNEAIADFSGRLTPMNVAKLLWRLKVKRPKTARLIMLGIKEKFRKQKRYMPLAVALVCEMGQRGRRQGYEYGELSWTLEDNGAVNALIKLCGGSIYKRYRIYEKSLKASPDAS